MKDILSRIIIGKGTLRQFQAEYGLINADDNRSATASQLFPTGDNEIDKETNIKLMVYEWVIYYKEKRQEPKNLLD